MKKTIIAASIAAIVAAPAAFADVSISGNVMAEFVEDQMFTNNDLVFKSSEDLGNGMKASAKYHLFHDDGNSSTADFSVTLSGDFGAISMGRQEGFDEGVFAAFSNIDAAHDADLEGYFDNGVANHTRDERIKYVSPSFNGLKVGVTAQDNGTDKFEDTEWMVSYSANGLSVAAGQSSEGIVDTTNFNVKYKMGDLEVRAASRNVERDATAAVAAVPYALNAATGAIEGTTAVAAGAAVDADATFLGAKYTMGANTIALGMVNADNGDANIFSVQHNFSKKTSVYAVVVDEDGGDNTTVLGLAQKF